MVDPVQMLTTDMFKTVLDLRDETNIMFTDPERLRLHNVTLDELVRAAGDAVVVGAGGFVETPNQRLAGRHLSPIESPEELARSSVAVRGEVPRRLGDVARVV